MMMSTGMLWLGAGVLLLVAEIIAPGVFLMWLGLAALGTGAVVLIMDPGFAVQVAVFGVLALSTVALGVRLRRARPAAQINTHDAGLVGRPARALQFDGRQGRVRVGDSDWPARVPGDVAPPAPGAALVVAGVDGVILVVRPAA
jgi:membrane protein implicated in regulation of membrane protease activity